MTDAPRTHHKYESNDLGEAIGELQERIEELEALLREIRDSTSAERDENSLKYQLDIDAATRAKLAALRFPDDCAWQGPDMPFFTVPCTNPREPGRELCRRHWAIVELAKEPLQPPEDLK